MKKLWNIIKLNKNKVLSIIRHIITAVGAILIIRGYAEESLINEITGAILSILGILWSFNEKTEDI